jgi:hypothetical protein
MKLLHQGASAATLRMVRLGVFGLWIAKIASDPVHRLADLPVSFFERIGVLTLIPEAAWRGLHTAEALGAIRALTVLCLVLALGGRWRTPAALVSCVLLTFHQGLVRGVGHVNHAELALLYAAYILAAFPVVEALERWAVPQAGAADRSDVPLVLIVTIFLLTYALTGISRVVLWAPHVFHPNNVPMWILADAHHTTYYTWQLGRHVLELPFWARAALSAGLAVVTLFEILAPCCLLSRRFRLTFLIVMAPMHVLVWVSMNILFWENLALFLLLLDIDPWIRSLGSHGGPGAAQGAASTS